MFVTKLTLRSHFLLFFTSSSILMTSVSDNFHPLIGLVKSLEGLFLTIFFLTYVIESLSGSGLLFNVIYSFLCFDTIALELVMLKPLIRIVPLLLISFHL